MARYKSSETGFKSVWFITSPSIDRKIACLVYKTSDLRHRLRLTRSVTRKNFSALLPMASLLDTETCIGKSIERKKLTIAKLGDHYSSEHAIFPGKAEDKDGPYFCAGLMNGPRSLDNLLHCTLIVVDVDEITPIQAERVRFMLDQSGYEHILYSTTRHTPQAPRFRLILNPSRVLDVTEYKYVVHSLCNELSIDTRCNASNVPSTPMILPLAVAETYKFRINQYIEGKPVDVDRILQAMQTDENWQESHVSDQTNEPMAIPGGLPEVNWLNHILLAYPAKGLDYEQWMEVGFALHHQTDARLFDLWLHWSRLNTEVHGRTIDENKMRYKWDRSKANPASRGVTLRHILNRKNTSNRTVLALAYRGLLSEIQEPEHLKALVSDIQSDTFVKINDYPIIRKELRKASIRVNNDELSIGEAMAMLRPDHKVNETESYYYENYLFSEQDSCYYDVYTKRPISIISMNYKYGSQMPLNNSGERKVVHKVLSNASNGVVSPRMMAGTTYDIDAGAVYVDQQTGKHYLNLFEPDSWPLFDEPWNTQDHDIDREIKAMIHSHFKLLCNGDAQVMALLLQHLAHLRQRPMKRIHFAYAISSQLHGVGKSTLIKLYKAVLGENQINLLSAANIKEDFNAYAGAPHLMSFIEEFEFDTRREQNTAIKKMKDLITNDQVSLRKMRVVPYKARAYTAYALFSNDEYVLGHESTGRRWVPIVVDSINLEQCSRMLGMEHRDFYNRYNQLLSEHSDRFCAYFDQLPLDGFNSEQPPQTAFKNMFVESIPAARMARVVKEIIEYKHTTDLTDSYASSNSAYIAVRNYIDFTDSSDADELKAHKPSVLRRLVTQALQMLEYRKVDEGVGRVRLPFSDCQRTQLREVWIKDHHRYGGSHNVNKLRRHMNKVIERRQFDQGKKISGKVVDMNGDPLEDL